MKKLLLLSILLPASVMAGEPLQWHWFLYSNCSAKLGLPGFFWPANPLQDQAGSTEGLLYLWECEEAAFSPSSDVMNRYLKAHALADGKIRFTLYDTSNHRRTSYFDSYPAESAMCSPVNRGVECPTESAARLIYEDSRDGWYLQIFSD